MSSTCVRPMLKRPATTERLLKRFNIVGLPRHQEDLCPTPCPGNNPHREWPCCCWPDVDSPLPRIMEARDRGRSSRLGCPGQRAAKGPPPGSPRAAPHLRRQVPKVCARALTSEHVHGIRLKPCSLSPVTRSTFADQRLLPCERQKTNVLGRPNREIPLTCRLMVRCNACASWFTMDLAAGSKPALQQTHYPRGQKP
jgi:hypothetical protein